MKKHAQIIMFFLSAIAAMPVLTACNTQRPLTAAPNYPVYRPVYIAPNRSNTLSGRPLSAPYYYR